MPHVIAYTMHEEETNLAASALDNAVVTDSFVVGDADDAVVEALQAKGIVVQPVAQIHPEETDPRPLDALPEVPSAPPSLAADGTAYYAVRLRGPLLEEYRTALADRGAVLGANDGTGGYLVRLTPDAATGLLALPFVEAVRPQETPSARDPGAGDEWIAVRLPTGSVTERLRLKHLRFLVDPDPDSVVLRPNPETQRVYDVLVHEATDLDAVRAAADRLGLPVVAQGRRKLRVRAFADAPSLDELGGMAEVRLVEEYVEPTLSNDLARAIVGADAFLPDVGLPALDGEGQLVGVADTGLDAHPDFAGRVDRLIPRGRPVGDDPNGHGTHVAGSILGDGARSDGQYRGVAPKARLVMQSLLDASGKLGGLPPELGDLFQEAYDAGVRLHNNSWGSATAARYTVDSQEVDEFVRTHPDMLLVIAAGNEGACGKDASRVAAGLVDWLSIGSPASCKNALSVGASRSSRTEGGLAAKSYGEVWPGRFTAAPVRDARVSGDPQSMAAFSSRGPVDDRRIKPDVVAPGTDVVSARSSLAAVGADAAHANEAYQYLSGTSMAAPLVTGCAALVRQYLATIRATPTPSAALLKAILINGTVWLSGDDAIVPHGAEVPNVNQGFGRINLPTTLPNPARPALRLEFADVAPGLSRTGERARFRVTAGPDEPLRLCLAYTDFPARGLQNDLNLFVQDLTDFTKHIGNESVPQALHIPDPDNNVEIVRLVPPDVREYLIQVSAVNLLDVPQAFALVVGGDLRSGLAPA